MEPINIGDSKESLIEIDRALYNKSCDLCKGRIRGGTFYVAIIFAGDYNARLHIQCLLKLNAQLELFTAELEKADNPPPGGEKED